MPVHGRTGWQRAGQVERTASRIDAIIAEERRRHPDRRVRV